VLVERDEKGDEDERPLKLKIIKPRKRPARKKEPVGVGAKGDDEPTEEEPGEDPSGGESRD
jgi:hypothetical protein